MTTEWDQPSGGNSGDDGESPLEALLIERISAGLTEAIDNSVQAQQQLYQLGVAVLSAELSKRLDAPAAEAETEESQDSDDGEDSDEPPASSLSQLAEKARTTAGRQAESPSQSSSDAAGGPASTILRLMKAYSVSMAMLNEVYSQQMLDIVLTAVASGIDLENPGPADIAVLEQLLNDNRLVKLLAEL